MIERLIDKLNKLDESTKYSPMVKRALDKIEKICIKSTGKKNEWVHEGHKFFLEWPEFESEDVSFVTGKIYEKVGVSSRFMGSYKIDKNGNIIKFPFFKK